MTNQVTAAASIPTTSPDEHGASSSSSLSERWMRATAMVESSPAEAIVLLEALQRDVASLALFSSNESIQDVSTKSLPLLALDYFLAMAHLGVPTSPGAATERKSHVLQSMDLFASFLNRLEQLELITDKEHKRNYYELLETSNNDTEEENKVPTTTTQGQTREQKIARFRAKQAAQNELQRLTSIKERRGRLGMVAQDEMDGYDLESLERKLALTTLSIYIVEALDEWHQARREIPMIDMMIQMEQQRNNMERHKGGSTRNGEDPRQQPRPPMSNKPLQLTHITKDANTRQLNLRKEEIKSQVFRPSWNQPTMTLEELGEIERERALEQEEKQRVAEARRKLEPRRYEQLVKDGMEDDADLVDASAKLDRAWDDFKDANPRGSGNKMGDRGDRNF